MKYADDLHMCRRREGLLRDARSIAPKNLAAFDRDWSLFNCANGTYSLRDMVLHPHSATDYITKISRVKYLEKENCKRWKPFIGEVMSGDADTARFLQKAMGYALSGDTSLECFFILHGSTTRNGKSTLLETMAYLFGDYSRTIQPQTLSRRPSDGSAASPDIARLKGARLVNMAEPEKGLELNIALIKQLTGGDTFTGRFLNENPTEFSPEFKIFINTNHLPRASDDTVFSSGRVKLIPFERHFKPEEQDSNLKKLFRRRENMSGILNWLIEGYRLLKVEGLAEPAKVKAAIEAYRSEADIIGAFLAEHTIGKEDGRVPTSELYALYVDWAKANVYKPLSNRSFTMDIHRRYEIRRTGADGRVVIGIAVKSEAA
jgi:putative DNA primase/helicase